MELETLRQLAKEAVTNKNWLYRDTPQDERLKLAVKSFQRIPDEQQTKVTKSWAECLGKSLPLEQQDIEDMVWFRFLSQTNLFFLCKLLEKYGQVEEGTHEEICNKFFVTKDPANYNRFEDFANSYKEIKDRLLLVPRGGFKSSIDMADTVQWIVNYPEVTILILTGVYDLAKDFVGEVTQHFTLEETNVLGPKGKPECGPRKMRDTKTGKWSKSMFQILFPEHCILPSEVKAVEFQTPAGGDDKEPTVRAASIEQNLSGWHYGIMKLDDVVTNENSLTITRLQAVNKQISVNRAMMHPYGFMDVIGTWYDDSDYYGITIKQDEKTAQEDGLIGSLIGSVSEGRFESNVNTKIYLRAAWWPTDDAKKLGKIEAEMKKEDWVLWFGNRLPYEFLLKEKKKDADGFAIKYLNNPRLVHQIKFPRELLVRRTIPHTQLPQQGMIVTVVDTAYSTKSWADYTVILTALIFGGRFFVIDMSRGRYNEFELPAMIAAAGNKWKPKRIAIEDSVGVKWMGRELRREMDKLGITIPVEYVSLGLGNKSKSKEIKAKPVQRLLGDERLFFTKSCNGLEEIYTELEKFGGGEATHDDIVSALSILVDQFAAYADMEAKINFAQEQFVSDRQSKEKHDMLYGIGRYSRYNASNAIDDNPVTVFQTEQHTETFSDIDPLADVFR